MTWGEFKNRMEEEGVLDTDELDWVDFDAGFEPAPEFTVLDDGERHVSIA